MLESIFNIVIIQPHLFLYFLEMGIILNAITYILVFLLYYIKGSSLEIEDVKKFIIFNIERDILITNGNSQGKRLLSAALITIPFYPAILNLIICFYGLRYAGSYGLVRGVVKTDQLALIELIKYKINIVNTQNK